jgi:ADP-sugar diphosphatase
MSAERLLLKTWTNFVQELDRQTIEDLRGKLTGEIKQGEMITLRICNFDDLWREGARDAKALAAWALYHGLSGTGALQAELEKRGTSANSTQEEAHASKKQRTT